MKTPLLEYIEQRKAEKLRSKEEKREERRKKEEKRRRRDPREGIKRKDDYIREDHGEYVKEEKYDERSKMVLLFIC